MLDAFNIIQLLLILIIIYFLFNNIHGYAVQVHESHDVGKTVGYVQTNLKRGTGQSLSRGLDNLTHMQQYVEPIYVYRRDLLALG